ncbi:MAG: hypothetical protein CHACPFDD_03505 [Phycisphaerae bacterium]|nr:hypothetical protein [Phycisphaerae bacterium]
MMTRVALDELRLPAPHREFLEGALPRLMSDLRIVGVLAAGSILTGAMDEFSDLDLVVAVEPEHDAAILENRLAMTARLGLLLSAFTGEHVGEPRIIIALFGPPPLHVDLKFAPVTDLAKRTDRPLVLCERGHGVSDIVARASASPARPDAQWIEDRVWVWVHYVAAKIGRGELFEALDGLAALRRLVLGPLALAACGAAPYGVRRIEWHVPEFAQQLRQTVADYDASSCSRALEAVADLYVRLRDEHPAPGLIRREAAQAASRAYLAGLSVRGNARS